MPGFDQTGPQGKGPLTGRGFGPCGRGRGLGRYFGWNVPQTKKEKVEDIQAYKKALLEEMEDLEKKLANLQKQN